MYLGYLLYLYSIYGKAQLKRMYRAFFLYLL